MALLVFSSCLMFAMFIDGLDLGDCHDACGLAQFCSLVFGTVRTVRRDPSSLAVLFVIVVML